MSCFSVVSLQREVQSSWFHSHRRRQEVSVEYSEDCCPDVAGRKKDLWLLFLFGRKQQGRSSLCETYVLVSLTPGGSFFFSTNEPHLMFVVII